MYLCIYQGELLHIVSALHSRQTPPLSSLITTSFLSLLYRFRGAIQPLTKNKFARATAKIKTENTLKKTVSVIESASLSIKNKMDALLIVEEEDNKDNKFLIHPYAKSRRAWDAGTVVAGK